MKFIDEVTIHVQAGKGGDGCCSFRREKFIPFGGPDGGDGGDGGDIYCKANASVNTLIDLNYQKTFRSQKGRAGSGNLRSGKSGEDLIINVPLGTIIFDPSSNIILGDLTSAQQVVLIAKGGRGGLGNHNFKTSTNRAPRKATKGKLGEERILRLELRLLADVGLLGLPNCGKSTLINVGSAAKAKIASYPFSTLRPQLGVVKCKRGSFLMADLPGILAGAAQGVGLGIRFLKHLARNKILLHLVDLAASLGSAVSGEDPSVAPAIKSIPVDSTKKLKSQELLQQEHDLDYYQIINHLWQQIHIVEHEIASYNDVNLSKIERWIVINKVDLLSGDQLTKLQELWQVYSNNKAIDKFVTETAVTMASTANNNFKIFWISAHTGYGTNALFENIVEHLGNQAAVVCEKSVS